MRPAFRAMMLVALPCFRPLACTAQGPDCEEDETRARVCPDGSAASQACAADGAWTQRGFQHAEHCASRQGDAQAAAVMCL